VENLGYYRQVDLSGDDNLDSRKEENMEPMGCELKPRQVNDFFALGCDLGGDIDSEYDMGYQQVEISDYQNDYDDNDDDNGGGGEEQAKENHPLPAVTDVKARNSNSIVTEEQLKHRVKDLNVKVKKLESSLEDSEREKKKWQERAVTLQRQLIGFTVD